MLFYWLFAQPQSPTDQICSASIHFKFNLTDLLGGPKLAAVYHHFLPLPQVIAHVK